LLLTFELKVILAQQQWIAAQNPHNFRTRRRDEVVQLPKVFCFFFSKRSSFL